MRLIGRLKYEETVEVAGELQQPILAILKAHGPLGRDAIRYFLNRRYAIQISYESLDTVLQTLKSSHAIDRDTRLSAGTYLYSLNEEINNEPGIPLLQDYTNAYIELLMRYNAIRKNPELATLPETLLDDMFNPEGAAEAT